VHYTVSYINNGQYGINNASLMSSLTSGLENIIYSPTQSSGYLRKTYGIAGDQCIDDYYNST
jgi:uncharacterized repeat protein (TIGR01451 family)